EARSVYLNDFYMITVTPTRITWEMMPQNGVVPTEREGHTLCVVKGKLYLFGGSSHPQAEECLPGVYCFDIVTLRWEQLKTGGVPLKSLRHSSAALGDNIYVYGGILDGRPTDNLMMFNTVSMIWTPIKATGALPSARYNHTCAVVNEQIFLFGGCGGDGSYQQDIHILNTETLNWQKCDVKGESPLSCAGQSFTAHHDKDIYLFGGAVTSTDGIVFSSNEIHKLSIAKMKWKVPLYVGIPPSRRHGHTAFILHSHMYVFGGKNEEQEFNDLKIMKLINPSERQPVMKEILSEFGLQGITAFRDFTMVRDEAVNMIQKAFTILDEEFRKLDRERLELSQAGKALQCERQAYDESHQRQTQWMKEVGLVVLVEQELQEMLERHKAQNEAWLQARAEENDKERKELCKLREEVLHEQEKLKEEQCNIQKRSEHLLSIMQQFKGM
ncbi:hypothetical protein P4O66_005989, partial [Electrophorus voltai]